MILDNKLIEDVLVVNFHEKVSIISENSLEFENIIKGYLKQANYRLILNCENLEFVDSSGLCAFISCLKEALSHNGWLKIVNIPNSIKYIFEIIKLDKIFDIFDSTETALASP